MRGLPLAWAIAALGALSAALYAAMAFVPAPNPGGAMARYLVIFPVLFGIYVAAVWMVQRDPVATERIASRKSATILTIILAFGLLFRAPLLSTPVYLSSDLFRYFWDGRVQLAGLNPYRYPPAAPELAPLRDQYAYHSAINRPTARTIYPPGAQWLFALAVAAGVRTVLAWRVAVLLTDAVTVILLLTLLGRFRLGAVSVLVYVWSPLVIFEGVQAGHVDLFMVPAVLLALRWRQDGKPMRAGVALGLAVLIKLYPLVLAIAWSAARAVVPREVTSPETTAWRSPRRGMGDEMLLADDTAGGSIRSWWRSRDWRFVAAIAATVALGYAPYVWTLGIGALGFLPEYLGSAEDHNLGLRGLLTYGLGLTGEPIRATVMAILVLVLLAGLLWIGRASTSASLAESGAAAVGAYLALVPTAMHAWYVVWMVPFLCFALSPAWLYFSGAVSLSYVPYFFWPASPPGWAWAAQWGPLFGLLALEGWRSHARGTSVVARRAGVRSGEVEAG